MKRIQLPFQNLEVKEEEDLEGIEIKVDLKMSPGITSLSVLYVGDRNLIVVPSIYRKIRIFDSRTYLEIEEINGYTSQLCALRWDDMFIVSHNELNMYSLDTFKQVQESVDIRAGKIVELFKMNEEILLVRAPDAIIVYDVAKNKTTKRLNLQRLPYNPFLSLHKSKNDLSCFFCIFHDSDLTIRMIDYEKRIVKKEFSRHKKENSEAGIYQLITWSNAYGEEMLMIMGNEKNIYMYNTSCSEFDSGIKICDIRNKAVGNFKMKGQFVSCVNFNKNFYLCGLPEKIQILYFDPKRMSITLLGERKMGAGMSRPIIKIPSSKEDINVHKFFVSTPRSNVNMVEISGLERFSYSSSVEFEDLCERKQFVELERELFLFRDDEERKSLIRLVINSSTFGSYFRSFLL